LPKPVTQCVVCDGTEFRTDRRATSDLNLVAPLEVMSCARCGLRLLNPQPTEDEYEVIYSRDYFSGLSASPALDGMYRDYPPVSSDYELDVVPVRERVFRARLQYLRAILPRGRTVLDIGAGTGEFLALARNLDWEPYGTELSAFARGRAREKFGLALTSVRESELASLGRTFDLIHLSHVFEHFTRPAEVLNGLRELTLPGSMLVIEVPNQWESLNHAVSKVRRLFKPVPRTVFSIHHPYFYSRNTLIRLVERHGFEVVRARTHIPEYYRFGLHRRIAGLISSLGDLMGGRGELIEIVAVRH
jgi:SAM-dependent methyltransferase